MSRGKFLLGTAAVAVLVLTVLAYDLWYPHHEAAQTRIEDSQDRREWVQSCLERSESVVDEVGLEAATHACEANYDHLVDH